MVSCEFNKFEFVVELFRIKGWFERGNGTPVICRKTDRSELEWDAWVVGRPSVREVRGDQFENGCSKMQGDQLVFGVVGNLGTGDRKHVRGSRKWGLRAYIGPT